MFQPVVTHTGVVVYTPASAKSPFRAIVLDLGELIRSGFPLLKKIAQEAFRLQDSAFVTRRKTRNADRPLLFGDHITWTDANHDQRINMIVSFNRVSPTFPSREVNGIGQFLIDGVIDPKKPDSLYSHWFRSVEIPTHLINVACPNVYIQTWISFFVQPLGANFEASTLVHSYERVCSVEKQEDVSMTVWNAPRAVEREVDVICMLSSDDDDIPAITHSDTGPKELTKDAYQTGEHTFYLPEFPMARCVLALKNPNSSWTAGAMFEVKCFWNHYERAYIIRTASFFANKRNWLESDFTGTKLTCTVRAHPTLRGVYENEKFGLMDDPHGLLAMYHLSRYKKTALQVSIEDRVPSRREQMRFSLGELAVKLTELEYSHALETDEIRVNDADGVFIEEGVFSAEHSPIIFKFLSTPTTQDGQSLMGDQITFDAVYDPVTKNFNITEWNFNRERRRIPMRTANLATRFPGYSDTLQTHYFVTARLVTLADSAEMLYCDEFGLVDDCHDLVNTRGHVNSYNVWVKATLPEESLRYPPRSPFHVIELVQSRDEAESILGALQSMAVNDSTEAEPLAEVNIEERNVDLIDQIARCIPPPPLSEPEVVDVETPIFGTHSDYDASENLTMRTAVSSSPPHRCSPYHNGRYFGFNMDRWEGTPMGSMHSFGYYACNPQEPLVFANLPMAVFPYSDRELTEGGDSYPDNEWSPTEEIEAGHICPELSQQTVGETSEIDGERKFDGRPVLAPPGSSFQYNIIETLYRLKQSLHHAPTCGQRCRRECPWITGLATILVGNDGRFLEEMRARYPELTNVVRESLDKVEV